jgi:hypothetical protein
MLRFPKYSIRSLLIVMACLAIPFSLWARAWNFHKFAGQHQFAAIDNGYKAVAIQRPVPPNWNSNGQSLTVAIASAPVQMYQNAIRMAAPFWKASLHHAELRDIYLNAARSPWMPLPHLPSLPANDPPLNADLAATIWWNNRILPYIIENPSLMILHPSVMRTDPKNFRLNHGLLTCLQWFPVGAFVGELRVS